jgi:hypothetical protein
MPARGDAGGVGILTTEGALILVEVEANRCAIRVWNPRRQTWWRTDLNQQTPHKQEDRRG